MRPGRRTADPHGLPATRGSGTFDFPRCSIWVARPEPRPSPGPGHDPDDTVPFEILHLATEMSPSNRKVALITGGAVRVGRALSLGMADAGFDVVVHYRSSAGPAREVSRRIEAMGRRALLVQGDVSRPGTAADAAEAVRREFGRLDLLVNSASSFRSADLMEIGEEEWDEVLGVNLKGPFLMVKALAPMLRAASGSVVNVLDLSAFQPWTGRPHHAVSKAGLLHLTKIMARVLAPTVRVNAIAPGTVLPPDDFDEDDLERERERTVLGTLGSPEDVVRTVLFLAASPFITGEVIVVDGGRGLGSAEG